VVGPQLVLLAAVAFGVVQMHTLGHPDPGHGAPHTAVAAVPEHGLAPAGHQPALASLEQAPAGHAPAGPQRALDPLTVCLAVLTALGLAGPLLALLAIGRTRRPATPSRRPACQVPAGRGPPLESMRPRRLALLSVLRI
jgi:hypothetical protein